MYNGVNDYKQAAANLNLTYEEHFKSHRADGRHVCTFAAFLEQLRNRKPDLPCPEELTEENFGRISGSGEGTNRKAFEYARTHTPAGACVP